MQNRNGGVVRITMNTKAAHKKIRLSFLHLAAFLFIYLGNILLFLALRGYFFIVMGLILTALVPFSFLTVWKLADSVTGTIFTEKNSVFLENSEIAVRQEDDIRVIFSIDNPSLLCALRGTWIFTVGNAFYGTSDRQKLLLSVPPRGKKQFQMTVTVTDLGRVVFACREFILADLLSIFLIQAPCSMECSFFVLPKQGSAKESSFPDAYSGVAELSENHQKGSDYSEVTDIRAYQPGDRPRDIHWKLSARQPDLMVKERTALAGSERVVLIALPPEKNTAEKLLAEGYRKIRGLLAEQAFLRLLIWDNHSFSFASHSCTSEQELDAAFCAIFHTDLQAHSSSLVQRYMKNSYPQLDSYLCLTQKEDSVQLEVCVNE